MFTLSLGGGNSASSGSGAAVRKSGVSKHVQNTELPAAVWWAGAQGPGPRTGPGLQLGSRGLTSESFAVRRAVMSTLCSPGPVSHMGRHTLAA